MGMEGRLKMHTMTFSGSRHFVLQPLSAGAFAAIAETGGSAICNSGLIDLGGQLIIFDTFLTPQAALDLRRSAMELYGRPPQIVINSHSHNDHIWGNQVFAADAQIISSVRTRELIATDGMEEFQWNSAHAAEQLEYYRNQYQSTTDEQEKRDSFLWMGDYGGVVEALPNLTVWLPGITFTSSLKICGKNLTAELITFEGAHSGSDTILHLAQAGIVFMGDLLFVNFHPYLADGDPHLLLKALREISLLDAVYFVPGHGPVGSITDLKLMMEYLEHCNETAHTLLETGNANEDGIKELKIPHEFENWQMSQFYRTNIKFICKRLSPP
jgi:cyclase